MEQVSQIQVLGGMLHRIRNYHPQLFDGSFNERLILQKTIYLMQSFDLFIGYPFNWYLRGPYSPQLAKDAYELVNRYEESPTVHFVESDAERRFSSFLRFIEGHVNDEYWLEAMASIHFLYHKKMVRDRDETFRMIRDKMSALRRDDFDSYWDNLCEVGLIGD